MKKILIVFISVIIILSGCTCKGNRDEDYIRGVRKIKEFSKRYWDSVNKLSKEPQK